jgi:hypothetical protein
MSVLIIATFLAATFTVLACVTFAVDWATSAEVQDRLHAIKERAVAVASRASFRKPARV